MKNDDGNLVVVVRINGDGDGDGGCVCGVCDDGGGGCWGGCRGRGVGLFINPFGGVLNGGRRRRVGA